MKPMRRFIRFKNAGRNWTKDELNQLRDLFIKGEQITSIASKLDRNDDAVVYRLIKIGLIGFPQEDSEENNGKPWEEHEKNKLLKEFKDGLSVEKIAKMHGRHKNAILYKLIDCRAFDFTNRLEIERYIHINVKELVGKKDSDNKINTNGGNKMGFERMPFDTTEQTEEKGLITGRRNAAFLRNKYQTELDNANAAVVNMVHYCQEQNDDLKKAFNSAQGLKATISAHEKERENAYDSLGNLLNKEKDFEAFMHKETTEMYKEVSKNQQAKNIKIKQRMIDSDSEMRFASMMKYLDKYPEYQTKSSFKKLMDKIEEKERELRQAKEEYNRAVSKYHELLQAFKIHIHKAEGKIKVYYSLLEEGKQKISETRYVNGIFHKLSSERAKQEVTIDTTKHRIAIFEGTLKIIKEEFSQYDGRKFVELEY